MEKKRETEWRGRGREGERSPFLPYPSLSVGEFLECKIEFWRALGSCSTAVWGKNRNEEEKGRRKRVILEHYISKPSSQHWLGPADKYHSHFLTAPGKVGTHLIITRRHKASWVEGLEGWLGVILTPRSEVVSLRLHFPVINDLLETGYLSFWELDFYLLIYAFVYLFTCTSTLYHVWHGVPGAAPWQLPIYLLHVTGKNMAIINRAP